MVEAVVRAADHTDAIHDGGKSEDNIILHKSEVTAIGQRHLELESAIEGIASALQKDRGQKEDCKSQDRRSRMNGYSMRT